MSHLYPYTEIDMLRSFSFVFSRSMFASSLHPDGQNIVLFDSKDAKCTKVDYVKINKVTISSTKL